MFRPARFLGHAHAQTIWPALFRRHRPRAVTTLRWPASDGRLLTVDVLGERPGAPGVLVLHGLEGSSRAGYVRGLLAAIEARGWNGAAANFRSCEPRAAADAGEPPERHLYHSGDTRDLPVLVEGLRARWGHTPLGAVGFSVGGNVLLKWLGERGAEAPLAAAVAVSPPFDLAACAAVLDAPGFFAAIYRGRLLRSLRRKAGALAARDARRFDGRAVRACRTFARFDELVTAPVFGFADPADYWARSSSAPFLPRIRRPTLIIAAEDDPMVPGACIPRAAIAGNPALSAHILPRGGHVGFVAGAPGRSRYLVDPWALEFLGARFAGV